MRISDWSSDVCSSDLPIRVNNLFDLFWKRVIFLCLPALLSGEATGAISFAQGPERGTNSAKQGTSSRNYSGNWRRFHALDPRWRPPWVQSMLLQIGRASRGDRVSQYV